VGGGVHMYTYCLHTYILLLHVSANMPPPHACVLPAHYYTTRRYGAIVQLMNNQHRIAFVVNAFWFIVGALLMIPVNFDKGRREVEDSIRPESQYRSKIETSAAAGADVVPIDAGVVAEADNVAGTAIVSVTTSETDKAV
jgi:hypothetical protein